MRGAPQAAPHCRPVLFLFEARNAKRFYIAFHRVGGGPHGVLSDPILRHFRSQPSQRLQRMLRRIGFSGERKIHQQRKAGSIANSIVALRGRSFTAPLPSCRQRLSPHPRCAPSTRAWPSHILVGLSFNALVHYVAGDRAPTCPAADRRKTKPSDREARARRGDRDRPTPKGTAERSARA